MQPHYISTYQDRFCCKKPESVCPLSLLTRFYPDRALDMDNPFKWRHYEGEIILQGVRWYLLYALSSRDVAELMAERGLSVDHTTIFAGCKLMHLKSTNAVVRI